MGLMPAGVPTSEELEWLKEARARVLLVIRARWVILAVMAAYSLYAVLFYRLGSAPDLTTSHKAIPVAAFALTIAYNAWYHVTYRWFARIRHLNLIQLLLDLCLVTIMVHFSGGAVSWFWTIYLVLILEAAFLGECTSDTWFIGIGSSLLYGAVLTSGYYGWVASVTMPFENGALQEDIHYLMLKWAWGSVVMIIVSGIAAHMMGKIRRRDAKLLEMVVSDGLTGLYNRAHFYLRLNSEVERGKRYDRTFSLLILDVDDFKKVNDTWGHLVGDELLKALARALRDNIRFSDVRPEYSVDLPCRIGGEEFAVIMPEASGLDGEMAAERLRGELEKASATWAAERVRKAIAALEVNGKKITVSIGVATFPEHGETGEEVVRAADGAMYRAKAAGKNRVVTAAVDPSGG